MVSQKVAPTGVELRPLRRLSDGRRREDFHAMGEHGQDVVRLVSGTFEDEAIVPSVIAAPKSRDAENRVVESCAITCSTALPPYRPTGPHSAPHTHHA